MLKNASLRCDLRGVKIVSRYFILAGVVTLLFLWSAANRVYAADTLQISNYSTSSFYSPAVAPRSQSFTTDNAFTLSKIIVNGFENFGGGTSIGDVWAEIFDSDLNFVASSTNFIAANSVGDYGEHQLIFNFTGVNLEASSAYWFSMTSDYFGDHTLCWWSSLTAGSTYPYGCGVFGGAVIPNCPGDINDSDFWFEVWGEPPNTIQIDFPENASSTPEFETFLVSGNNIESAEDYRMVAEVRFGVSSSSLDYCPANFLSNENEYLGAFESHIYNWFVEQPQTTYYAQARLLYCPLTDALECAFDPAKSCSNPGSYEVKATSTLISYYITGDPGIVGGGLPMPTSTATSTEFVMTCDPTDNLFQRSLCYLFQTLFSPKQSDLNQFDNLRIDLANKAPFGYFGAIKNALTGLAATSSLAFDLSASVGVLAPILTPLRAGFIFILWLTFGFWLFKRIKHFEL